MSDDDRPELMQPKEGATVEEQRGALRRAWVHGLMSYHQGDGGALCDPESIEEGRQTAARLFPGRVAAQQVTLQDVTFEKDIAQLTFTSWRTASMTTNPPPPPAGEPRPLTMEWSLVERPYPNEFFFVTRRRVGEGLITAKLDEGGLWEETPDGSHEPVEIGAALKLLEAAGILQRAVLSEVRDEQVENENLRLRTRVWGALAPKGCPAYTADPMPNGKPNITKGRGFCDPLTCDCFMGDFDTEDDFIGWCERLRSEVRADSEAGEIRWALPSGDTYHVYGRGFEPDGFETELVRVRVTRLSDATKEEGT